MMVVYRSIHDKPQDGIKTLGAYNLGRFYTRWQANRPYVHQVPHQSESAHTLPRSKKQSKGRNSGDRAEAEALTYNHTGDC